MRRSGGTGAEQLAEADARQGAIAPVADDGQHPRGAAEVAHLKLVVVGVEIVEEYPEGNLHDANGGVQCVGDLRDGHALAVKLAHRPRPSGLANGDHARHGDVRHAEFPSSLKENAID